LNDRFWQPGGNPDLRAEDGWTFDAGLWVGHRQRAEAELTAFTHHIRDQIVWLPDGGLWSPTNFSRVQSRGVEASGRVRLPGPGRFEGGFFYTLTDARDRSDAAARSYGRPLRYVPRHQLKAFADGTWRRLSLGLAARYTGRRFVTTDGSQWLDAFWTLNATLGVQGAVGPTRLTLSAHLENLLDAAYEGIKGYPMPPRTLRLRLLVELGRPSP
jgi:iron complex outermembrane receptor protein